MKFKKKYCLVIGLFFGFQVCYAGNLSTNGVATRAQSMEAFTAVADDPSAVYYNPAGLTQIQSTEIDAGASLIAPDITYKNAVNGATTNNTYTSVGPNLFASTNKLDPIYLGIGVYSPDARISNYDQNLAVYDMMHFAKLIRVDIAPTFAVALSKDVSIGAGIIGSRISAFSNVLGLDQIGTGYGVSAQAGLLLKLPLHAKLGFTYHGPETAHIKGTGKIPGLEDDYTLDFNFPQSMSVGLALPVLKSLLLSVSYDYEMWNTLKKINVTYNNDPVLNSIATVPVFAHNSDNVRVGLMFTPEPKDEFRLGYLHITPAIPEEYVIPAIPDYTGNIYAIGYSHYFSKLRLDAGYEYSAIVPLESHNFFFPGKHTGHLNTYMLGIGYTL